MTSDFGSGSHHASPPPPRRASNFLCHNAFAGRCEDSPALEQSPAQSPGLSKFRMVLFGECLQSEFEFEPAGPAEHCACCVPHHAPHPSASHRRIMPNPRHIPLPRPAAWTCRRNLPLKPAETDREPAGPLVDGGRWPSLPAFPPPDPCAMRTAWRSPKALAVG